MGTGGIRAAMCAAVLLSIGLTLLLAAGAHAEPPDARERQTWDQGSGASQDNRNPLTTPRSIRSPERIGLYTGIALGIIAVVFLGVGHIVKQPAHVSVVPIHREDLTDPDKQDYIDTMTRSLAGLGFSPMIDFTVPELPQQGLFRVLSLSDGSHTVMVAQVQGGGFGAKQYVNYIEFQTILDDDAVINTSNSPVKSGFTAPDNYLITRHPKIGEPSELFNVHRKDVHDMQTKRGRRIKRQTKEEFARTFTREWSDIMELQAKRGLLKKKDDGKHYRATFALVMRTVSPNLDDMNEAVEAMSISLAGAAVTLVGVITAPYLIALTGLDQIPFAARLYEAAMITVIATACGAIAGSGGYLLGLMCYLPSVIIFESGPIGVFLPTILAANSGLLGEKIANISGSATLPLHKQLSPEMYLSLILIVVSSL